MAAGRGRAPPPRVRRRPPPPAPWHAPPARRAARGRGCRASAPDPRAARAANAPPAAGRPAPRGSATAKAWGYRTPPPERRPTRPAKAPPAAGRRDPGERRREGPGARAVWRKEGADGGKRQAPPASGDDLEIRQGEQRAAGQG